MGLGCTGRASGVWLLCECVYVTEGCVCIVWVSVLYAGVSDWVAFKSLIVGKDKDKGEGMGGAKGKRGKRKGDEDINIGWCHG